MSWDTQYHLHRVKTSMAMDTQRTLSPDIFSYGIVQCTLRVSIHISENARKHVFIYPGIWAWWQKEKYFPPLKPGYLQLNFPEKQWFTLLSLHQKFWWWFWVFWNKMEMCETTAKNHKTCFSELGNWTLMVNVTCATCGSWIIVSPNFQKNIPVHCWEYTPRKPELKETRVPQCSSQHCL